MNFLAALAIVVLGQEGWEYRQGKAVYVNAATMEQKTPEAWFGDAMNLSAGGDLASARTQLRFLAQTLPADTPAHQRLKERAAWESAKASYALNDFPSAFLGFDEYLRLAPDGEEALGPKGARWHLCQSAFNLAQLGLGANVGGLAVYQAARSGIDLLKKSLQRYPRERYSDDFYLALGEFLLKEGRIEEARTEFEFILTPGQYDRTNSAPPAQLRLAETYLRRFKSVEYDPKVLADAKREYEKFLSAWGRVADDAKSLAVLETKAETMKTMLEAARAGIRIVDEKLAEKEWVLASYYEWKGKPAATRVYLRRILKDYGATSWAEKAKKRLEELEK